MNDYATDDFLSKNIRVRPPSCITRGDDDGKTNDAYNKSMYDNDYNEDHLEKEEKIAVADLIDKRAEIKKLRLEQIKKREIEEQKKA